MALELDSDLPVRLDVVQELYRSGHLSLAAGVETYLRWRDYHEGLLILAENVTKGTRSFIGIQARKRGNKVHEWYVREQLRPILDFADRVNYALFDDDDPLVKPGGAGLILRDKTSKAYTNCVMITLEYNANAGSVTDCWQNIGRDLNRFFASLRRHFGKVSYIRAYESHESGYPHIHMILFFKESWLKVFKFHEKFRCQITPLIKLLWSRPAYGMVDGKRRILKAGAKRLGFVDVLAVNNLGGGIRYMAKYILKMNKALENSIAAERDKLILTLALNWLHSRRAFAISGDFVEVMRSFRRDSMKHNSNRYERIIGSNNEEYYRRWYTSEDGIRRFDLYKYYYCGSYAWSSIILCSSYSTKLLDNSPFIVADLDIEMLPSLDRIRLNEWVKQIDDLKRDLIVYMEKSREHYEEYVCIHCREYHSASKEKMREHIDLNKCRILKSRRAVLEFRIDDVMLNLLGYGFRF